MVLLWAQDSDQAVAVYGFVLEETVVVQVSAPSLVHRIDVRDVTGNDLVLGRIIGVTGAITDYELRVAAEGVATRGEERLDVGAAGLELRLVAEEIGGTPPSFVNGEVTEFVAAVSPPDFLRLFEGGNNVRENTTFILEARLDLADLPAAALASGTTITYAVTFMIVER